MQFTPRSTQDFERFIAIHGQADNAATLEALRSLARRQMREAETGIPTSRVITGRAEQPDRWLTIRPRRADPGQRLAALQRLLALDVADVPGAVAEARRVVREALGVDDVDIVLDGPAIGNMPKARARLETPVHVAGLGRGLLVATSATPAWFGHEDQRFLEAVARWLSLSSTALPSGRSAAVADGDGELTVRQLQIAALIRRGLTNAEIADRLILGTGTVANHVANILARLGLRSRAQIAAWATEHELDETHLYA